MATANLSALVPAWFACHQLGITKQTFRYWVASGKLAPAGGKPRSPLYRYSDVVKVDKQTRNSPNSRRGMQMSRESVGAST